MKKIFGSFKSIKPLTIAVALPISLAYPIIKSVVTSSNKLVVFSDSLFITSLILIALGVISVFIRFGDFDITGYVFRRGVKKDVKSFREYKKDKEDERKETFNYPLFFGLVFLLVSGLVAFLCL